MRVRIRVRQNAGDGDGAAADLAGDIAIEVLGGDDCDRCRLRRRGRRDDAGEYGESRPAHAAASLSIDLRVAHGQARGRPAPFGLVDIIYQKPWIEAPRRRALTMRKKSTQTVRARR